MEAQQSPRRKPGKEPAHLALAGKLREMIRAGELKPGYRFPPTKEMAKQWSTYPLLVHRAFQTLADEGLVERLHSVGTFVSSSSPELGSALIYLGDDIMEGEHLKFVRAVYGETVRMLKAEGVRVATMLDPRDGEGKGQPWPLLLDAFRKKESQTLIAISATPGQMRWIKELPVVWTSTYEIHFDDEDFAEKACLCLKEQGCRSAGFLTSIDKEKASYSEPLLRAFARHGIETREEWLLRPDTYFNSDRIETYGYERTVALCRMAERPEGLVAYPDILTSGIVSGLAHERMRIPEGLKLVLHKNSELPLSCPFPAKLLASSVSEYAAALIAQLKRKLRGEAGPLADKLRFRAEDNAMPELVDSRLRKRAALAPA